MRIKPLVVLSLVCSLSQAADTVASLGDSIKATQFVTAVDHSNITDGTGKVYFVDGVAYEDVVTTTTIVEREPVSVWFHPIVIQPASYTPPWSSIKVEVDYSAWTNSGSEPVVESGRRIKDIASPNNYLYVSDYSGNPDPNGGCIYTHDPNVEIPYIGELANVYTDEVGVACMFYMRDAGGIVLFERQAIYTNYTETAITVLETNSYRVATTADIQSTNGLASTTWVNSKKWDWATQVTNAPSFASTDHEHDHLTSNNGEWKLVQMDDGRAVVMPSYYYGEDNGLGVKFMPSIPIEDMHDICSTNAAARIPSSMEIELDGSVSSAGYGYTMGSGNTTTFYATNKVSYAEGVVFPDTVQITFDVPFTSGRIYIYNIPILCGSKKTLVTADYIKSKVQNVNVNLQSAEDTRVALTNLITILKNL